MTLATWYEANTGVNDAVNWIHLFAWLNKMNPDWKRGGSGLVLTTPGLSGEGYFPAPAPGSAIINVVGGAEKVDRWWGSAQIGKYGVLTTTNDDHTDDMPYQFVNAQNCRVYFNNPEAVAIHYCFYPGVQAQITINCVDTGGGGFSNVPPLKWLGDTGGYNILDEVTTDPPVAGNQENIP
jgi:hypothetical protein